MVIRGLLTRLEAMAVKDMWFVCHGFRNRIAPNVVYYISLVSFANVGGTSGVHWKAEKDPEKYFGAQQTQWQGWASSAETRGGRNRVKKPR